MYHSAVMEGVSWRQKDPELFVYIYLDLFCMTTDFLQKETWADLHHLHIQ